MKILSVASECAPLVKTGGLADVVGALPGALRPLGVEMRVILPGYSGLADRLTDVRRIDVPLAGEAPAQVLEGHAGALSLLLVEAPDLYDRPGGPYQAGDGRDYPDNDLRFAYFARVAAAVARSGAASWRPDLVHAHDWQAGLTPVYLRSGAGPPPPTLMTIHNIAFQGLAPMDRAAALRLPEAALTMEGAEYWGQIGFLKGGLALADRISTVSPSYVGELMTEAFGMGLDGLLRRRARDVVGILNGIDTTSWDPAGDPSLAAPYSAADMSGRAANRQALGERFGLTVDAAAPLYIVISRLTRQKGLDLLGEVLPVLLESGGALAVLGTGEPDLERLFRDAAKRHAGRVGFVNAFDEPLSRLMLAGGDAILVPSRYEPCGLTQLLGQRYGAVPIVARTGGLADTVVDANVAARRAGVATGIMHAPDSAEALAAALRLAAELFGAPGTWERLVSNAMALPVGWETSAAAYKALYASMLETAPCQPPA